MLRCRLLRELVQRGENMIVCGSGGRDIYRMWQRIETSAEWEERGREGVGNLLAKNAEQLLAVALLYFDGACLVRQKIEQLRWEVENERRMWVI